MYSGLKQFERLTLSAALALGLTAITGSARTAWSGNDTSQFYVPQSSYCIGGTYTSRTCVREAQRLLRNDGYYLGHINGKQTHKTRSAVRGFQRDNNLNITGYLNANTMAALQGTQLANQAQVQNQNTQQAPATAPAPEATANVNQAPPAPAPPPPAYQAPMTSASMYPAQYYHSSATIRHAQRLLRYKGFYEGRIDGIAGPETQAAIRHFQRSCSLNVTGYLTPRTLSALGVTPALTTGEASRYEATGWFGAIHSIATVRHAQRLLRYKGFYEGRIDGLYGPETHAAIRHFQAAKGLTVTGRLTRQTLNRLGVG